MDQALVSGSNVLTAIVLVRTIGLHAFGIHSFAQIVLQSLAALQVASIIAPMMTNFEQRGSATRSEYFGVILLHQAGFTLAAILLISMVFLAAPQIVAQYDTSFLVLACALFATSQLQDLVRRFCFVTDRSLLAFVSDAVANLGRLLCIAALFYWGGLNLERVWAAYIVSNVVACLVLASDILRVRLRKTSFQAITQMHSKMIGWMVGSAITQWISGNLYLIMLGSVLGAEALGAIRAVQNVIGVANIAIQSLENFIPSETARILHSGGTQAMLRYTVIVSATGFILLTAIAIAGGVLVGPLMSLIYGRAFEHQLALFLCFAAIYLISFVQAVLMAALRALHALGKVFWPQTIIGLSAIPAGWMIAYAFESVGAVTALLVGRGLMLVQLILAFSSAVRSLEHRNSGIAGTSRLA